MKEEDELVLRDDDDEDEDEEVCRSEARREGEGVKEREEYDGGYCRAAASAGELSRECRE